MNKRLVALAGGLAFWLAAGTATDQGFSAPQRSATVAGSKPRCGPSDFKDPEKPKMVLCDTSLLRGDPENENDDLPEWSKVEKLLKQYRDYSEANARCSVPGAGSEISELYVSEPAPAGPFEGDTEIRFIGRSRSRFEDPTRARERLRFALPIDGPADLHTVAGQELQILLDDLAQVELVRVPRMSPMVSEDQECFLISSITLVPSRALDDQPREAGGVQVRVADISLRARKEALERIAAEVDWVKRLSKEPLPVACQLDEGDGYLGRQVSSLNLTLRELLPEVDFVKASIEFWNEIKTRINDLRSQDREQISDWKTVIEGQRQR